MWIETVVGFEAGVVGVRATGPFLVAINYKTSVNTRKEELTVSLLHYGIEVEKPGDISVHFIGTTGVLDGDRNLQLFAKLMTVVKIYVKKAI